MDKEIISIIKEQNKLLFENIYEQIKTATLEKRIDNVNNSRFLFHMIHSMDRYFINPFEYDYLFHNNDHNYNKLYLLQLYLSFVDYMYFF